ncbi:MAG: putative monovalent cation/H+ antiporter subunit A [Bryobacteraceae bacterium]|nr:putative monovalent cation/H+ antiporter subunit A [Bryobacteraceae bacterium]
MLTITIAPFLVAILAPAICRFTPRACGWILALLPLGLVLYLASLAPTVWNGQTVVATTSWAPSLGLDLAFRLDGLGLLFALLITGIGVIVVFYSGGYLAGHRHLGRYYVALLMFLGSMLGVVLADNVILLFVFWELTSITSYLLIGFDHEREAARNGALQALLVTGTGGLALLAGLLMAAQITGTYQISGLLAGGDLLRDHPLYPAVLALILLGAFTKSAQFPFHFWLPNAMEAPTPASAYLHAATMVKAGVYLLARLTPALGGTDLWWWTVTLTGAVTMLAGAWLALRKTDLKQILAYSTISVLGILTLLLGIGDEAAWTAMAIYLVAHGLYKGALFLVAGAVDHEAGTRDITRLGGLRSSMPMTAIAALAAGVSMAGLPPMVGFIGKELVLEASMRQQGMITLTAAVAAAGALLFAAAGLAAVRPFFGAAGSPPKDPHEAPLTLWLGPLLLAGSGLLLGLAPGWMNAAAASAAGAIAGSPSPPVKLALFHGFNTALLLSLLTAAAGTALYLGCARLRKLAMPQWGPAGWYDAALDGVMSLAAAQTRILQNGYLRYYLLTMIAATVGLTGYAIARLTALPLGANLGDVQFHEVVLVIVILVSVAVAVRSPSSVTAVAALGVVGLGMALIFVLFGAPDLAMTQVVVDILTVVLLVLVLHSLPQVSRPTKPGPRFRDASVASSAGLLIGLLVLGTAAIEHPADSARYFIENSLPLAGGRNVVNVILADFRVLDTLGEVTVIAVAAVGVFALRRLRERPGEKS